MLATFVRSKIVHKMQVRVEKLTSSGQTQRCLSTEKKTLSLSSVFKYVTTFINVFVNTLSGLPITYKYLWENHDFLKSLLMYYWGFNDVLSWCRFLTFINLTLLYLHPEIILTIYCIFCLSTFGIVFPFMNGEGCSS